MKKYLIILSLLISFLFTNAVFAVGFIPRKSTFIEEYGLGVFYAPRITLIYEAPNENSKIAEIIKWDEKGASSAYSKLKPKDMFLAFIPKKKIVLLAVNDDKKQADGYWCQVVYDQKNNKIGWTKVKEGSKFYTWRDFLNRIGRMNGMYFWKDFPQDEMVLRSAPSETAQVTSQFNNSEMINLQFIRGNWALIKVNESDVYKPVGWIQWRDISGKIFLFPKLIKD